MMNIHARLYQIAKSNLVRFAAVIALASPLIATGMVADAGKRNQDSHQKAGSQKSKADRGNRGNRGNRAENRGSRDGDRNRDRSQSNDRGKNQNERSARNGSKSGPDRHSRSDRRDGRNKNNSHNPHGRGNKHADKMRDHRSDHPNKREKSKRHHRPDHDKKHRKHNRPDRPKKHTKMMPPPHMMDPRDPPESRCEDTIDYRYTPDDIRYWDDCALEPRPRKKHHYVKHHYGQKYGHKYGHKYGRKQSYHHGYSHRKHGRKTSHRRPIIAYSSPAYEAPYQMPTVTHRAPYEPYVDGGSVVSDLQQLKSSIARDFGATKSHYGYEPKRRAKPSLAHRKHRGHRIKMHHRTRPHAHHRNRAHKRPYKGRMHGRVVGVNRKTIRCIGYPGQLETVRCETVRTEFIPR